MLTPLPSASGAHTRIRLSRLGIEIHATLASFDRTTGGFTAFLDTDPAGSSTETFTAGSTGYTDSQGFVWKVIGQ